VEQWANRSSQNLTEASTVALNDRLFLNWHGPSTVIGFDRQNLIAVQKADLRRMARSTPTDRGVAIVPGSIITEFYTLFEITNQAGPDYASSFPRHLPTLKHADISALAEASANSVDFSKHLSTIKFRNCYDAQITSRLSDDIAHTYI
jgi:hypothetical protein